MGGLLGTAAALGCAGALVAPTGTTAGRATTARHGLASLPAAAQGPVSSALGRDQPAYRVRGLQAVNPAQGLRVGFSRRGVTVASGGARLSMALSAYGYASAQVSAAATTPRASANRVSYAHGSLTEWFANGPLGLEQGFDVSARPIAGSGPLTFSLALSGNLAASLQGGSLLLDGRGVALRYGGLLATDARGRVLHSWLELAGDELLIRVDDRGASYPLQIDPFLQQAELSASDGEEGDELGLSVADSEDTIVVGAPFHPTGGNMEQGEAYVFARPESGWANATQTAELISEKGQPGERFGKAVAVSGNTIVVGAPDREVITGHNEQGAVYVFVKPASGWAGSPKQAAELTAENGEVSEFFGESVAVSGETIVAGAPQRKVGGHEHQGAAYVFTMPKGGWANMHQTAELTASKGAENDDLGHSVAVSGDTVLAGAPGHKVGEHEDQGAAYVFVKPASGWAGSLTQTAELAAGNGAANDGLGTSVAMSGDTVLAGAPSHKVGEHADQGAAYVFVMPASGWAGSLTQTAELTAGNGAANDHLGDAVAVSGDTVLAGAPLRTVTNTRQGAVYVFIMPSSGWTGSLNETAELTAGNGNAEDHLGEAVAVSGDTVLAGAPGHEVGKHEEQGAAYVFEQPPSISISSPVNGATYTQGQVVAAEYSCPTAPGTTVTCSGTVANGAPIETRTLGAHTFTVSVIDSDALSATPGSVSYTVVAAPVTVPISGALTAPIVSGLSETARTWREGHLLAQISTGASKQKKKPPIGTTFSFGLNESASVTFTFTESAGGRKVGKKCEAQTNKNKHKHRCTRTVLAGTLTFSAHAGTNKVHFEGLISKHEKLAPGSYTLLVTATASGKRSATSTLHFTIAYG
ncbi:MAG: FG-GAP repeat protein [Solirubrobacteraceae bacterium]